MRVLQHLGHHARANTLLGSGSQRLHEHAIPEEVQQIPRRVCRRASRRTQPARLAALDRA